MNNRNEFYKTELEEQETIINIIYPERRIDIYTCRPAVHRRIKSKLGEPTKTYTTNGLISGASWTINFDDERVKSIISKLVFIGSMK